MSPVPCLTCSIPTYPKINTSLPCFLWKLSLEAEPLAIINNAPFCQRMALLMGQRLCLLLRRTILTPIILDRGFLFSVELEAV